MSLRTKFVRAIDSGKLWPTLVFTGVLLLLSAALIAGGTLLYLRYRHVILTAEESAAAYGSPRGTRTYLYMLQKLRDAGSITPGQYEQMRNEFTPDMARRMEMAGSDVSRAFYQCDLTHPVEVQQFLDYLDIVCNPPFFG